MEPWSSYQLSTIMHAKLVSMAFLIPDDYIGGLYSELKKTETLLARCNLSPEFKSRLTIILRHSLDGSARLNMQDVNARVMAIMSTLTEPTGANTKVAPHDN